MNGQRALLVILQRTLGRYVAARCGVPPSCVSDWASGRKRPCARSRAALEACYGIPAKAWLTDASKH
jgi:DNA-binding transcriptional regulator YdaS (Cro superfamily)